MSRLLTAAVAVPLLVLIIMRGPAEAFLLLVLVMALGGQHELSKLLPAPLGVGYLLVGLTALSPHPWLPKTAAALALSVAIVGTLAVLTLPPGKDSAARVAATGFGLLYLGVPLSAVSAIRLGPPDGEARLWIVFLLAVIMVGDAGAFYVGSALGKRRLAPALSPKKTVEGLLGGVFFAIAAAVIVQRLWMPFVPLLHALPLGLLLALSGVAGDLFESFLKRSAGVKDTASVFPGHGGVLDRIDSLLFAAPVLFVYVAWRGPFSSLLE